MMDFKDPVKLLSPYFAERKELAFAYLFGSGARGSLRADSDLDVAVYFFPSTGILELEEEIYYETEKEIWGDIDRLTNRETDLLVMNRAPARIVYTALTEGLPLHVSDKDLLLRVLLAAGRLFEDYRDFTGSFTEIKRRARSLSGADRDRLLRIVDFLETELEDSEIFTALSYRDYVNNSSLRRNVERWIENLVNASVDAAKIITASEKKQIPQTYRETLKLLSTVKEFPETLAAPLSDNTRLRNILAHEYLDIRYKFIESFLKDASSLYRDLCLAVKRYAALP